jgi:hypothetical protein
MFRIYHKNWNNSIINANHLNLSKPIYEKAAWFFSTAPVFNDGLRPVGGIKSQ